MSRAPDLSACSSTGDSPKDSSPTDTRVDSPVMKEASVDLNRDAMTQDTALDKAAPKDLAAGDSGPCKPGEFVLKVGTTPKCIPLPTGVTLPVDSSQEADAIKKAANCSCKCKNGWTKNKTKWKCYCCTLLHQVPRLPGGDRRGHRCHAMRAVRVARATDLGTQESGPASG